jgi:hypothetical protein
MGDRGLRVIETGVLAVRSVSCIAAPEVSRGNNLAIALVGQQLDEPGLVFDFLVRMRAAIS